MIKQKLSRNNRRFFRVDLNTKCIIVPKTYPGIKDILYNDIDYFPPFIENKFRILESNIAFDLTKIEGGSPHLAVIIRSFLLRLKLLKECLHEISNGINPNSIASAKDLENKLFSEMHDIKTLQENSPKSYAAFKSLEVTLKGVVNELKFIVFNSNTDKFYFNKFPDVSKAELIINRFENDQYLFAPLAQILLNIAKLIIINNRIMKELCIDNGYSKDIKIWPIRDLNISEGGARLKVHKRFKTGMSSVLMLAINEKEVLELDSKVVIVNSEDGNEHDDVAVNFEFPSTVCQTIIRRMIQSEEISKSMKVYFNAGY